MARISANTNAGDPRSNEALASVGEVLGGYQPGYEVIAGSHKDAIEEFSVLSARGNPRLMLPRDNPALSTSISSFLGNRRYAKLIPLLMKVSEKAGSPLPRTVSVMSLLSESGATSPLRQLLENVLDTKDFHIALRLSFGRPNAKTVAMAISNTGKPLCYGKFGSEAMTNALVAHESSIFDQFENTEMPILIPRRLFSGEWANGHFALITEPLDMVPLTKDASKVHQASDAFALQNLDSNGILQDSPFWKDVEERVGKLEGGSTENQVLANSVARIKQKWGNISFDFCASHGDWTRANIGMVGQKVAAIDWERFTTDSPRGIDIAHFAIAEQSFHPLRKTLNMERLAENVRRYQKNAGVSTESAESLIILSLLQMVIRFNSARRAGVRSADSTFGPALQAGLELWAA